MWLNEFFLWKQKEKKLNTKQTQQQRKTTTLSILFYHDSIFHRQNGKLLSTHHHHHHHLRVLMMSLILNSIEWNKNKTVLQTQSKLRIFFSPKKITFQIRIWSEFQMMMIIVHHLESTEKNRKKFQFQLLLFRSSSIHLSWAHLLLFFDIENDSFTFVFSFSSCWWYWTTKTILIEWTKIH